MNKITLLTILVVASMISIIFVLIERFIIQKQVDIPLKTNLLESNFYEINKPKLHFAIIPHFLLGYDKIDKFYLHLSNNIENLDNIVIISPNHYGLGRLKNHQVYCENEIKLLYDKFVVNSKGIGTGNNISCIDEFLEYTNDYKIIKEHGIGSHWGFINKYFPDVKVTPIIMNQYKLNGSDNLVETLRKEYDNTNTLFIASVDFSHKVQEDFAYYHDKKTYYTLLNSLNLHDYASIEVDCPNCLYVLNKLASIYSQYPVQYHRDSSSQIMSKDLNYGNTSRQFYYYTGERIDDNGLTMVFYGDLIYDRGVKQVLNTNDKLLNKFKDYFEDGLVENANELKYHKKLFGLDFAGLNLEMPAVKDPKTCTQSSKSIAFCGDAAILKVLKLIGFNIVNIANNHSLDGGKQAHLETLQNLEENQINYFGYLHNANFSNNYIYTGNIRGIDFAMFGLDFVVTKLKIKTYCEELEKFRADGYQNIVNVHWGNEYETTHNSLQESIAHQLIDCGADLIVGHHPHVVQDVGSYKGVPIIYSLGNYLFDQGFSEYTKKGMYVLVDLNNNGKTSFSTGEVNSYFKE